MRACDRRCFKFCSNLVRLLANDWRLENVGSANFPSLQFTPHTSANLRSPRHTLTSSRSLCSSLARTPAQTLITPTHTHLNPRHASSFGKASTYHPLEKAGKTRLDSRSLSHRTHTYTRTHAPSHQHTERPVPEPTFTPLAVGAEC